jgi:CubicO group peptidase (beta-lactamase class C family)/heat shock protein HslJ
MRAKPLLLALKLSIMMLFASSCNAVGEEQPESMPEVTLESTAWTLEVFIEGQAISLVEGTEVTLRFESDHVRGSAGCNDYGGAYTLERGTLSIPQIDITEQLCLEPAGIMAQESRYLDTLREVTVFQWDADRLTLRTADGVGLRFGSRQPTAVMLPPGPNDPSELEAFLDAYFAEQMSTLHIPGATFALVKDGRIVLSKGYGYADLENQVPYYPDRTLFWAASIAKIFSVVGALQLHEQGLIHLEDDVNRYLADFQIPDDYSQPVTFHSLLTHTDGFEARIIGDAARTAADLRPLRTVVQRNLPNRVAPPGRFLTYGNYATNLAGVLIEDVSGISFSAYMETNIFRPLEMNRTTFQQILPPGWIADLAVGYGFSDGQYDPKPFVYVDSLPQGGARSTATDMAHFMIALLQGGRYRDIQLLNSDTVRLMFQQQFTAHPSLGGITYGLFEIYGNGQRLLIRDGDGWGFRSRMMLIPDQNLGFFVNYNNEDADGLRKDLISQFLDHYYPISAHNPPAPRADSVNQVEQFAGIYRPLQADESTFFKIALLFAQQIRVTDGKDGTLLLEPLGMGDNYGGFEGASRWVETEPLFFRQVDGKGELAFGPADDGRIEFLFSGQKYHGTYRKIAWYETPGLHVASLGVSAVFLLGALFLWPVEAWLKRRRGILVPPIWPRLARWLAGIICALHVAFLVAITIVMGSFVDIIYGVPGLLRAALVLPLLAAFLAPIQVVMIVLAWRNRYWSIWGRAFYTMLTAVVLSFTWWLDYWNLLGFRY